VKQSDLGEYEEKAAEKQMDTDIQDRTQAPPLKLSNRMANTKFETQHGSNQKLKIS
jgi:hypothetical protein